MDCCKSIFLSSLTNANLIFQAPGFDDREQFLRVFKVATGINPTTGVVNYQQLRARQPVTSWPQNSW